MKMNNVTTSIEFPTQLTQCSFPFLIFVITTLLLHFATKSAKTSQRRHELPPGALPPGPPGWPIIGNLADIFMNRPVHRWIHRFMNEMRTEIACFRFANVHVITISSDKIALEALVDKDAIFSDRPESYSASVMSCGYKDVIFSHYGDQWKKMRRVMTSELMSPGRLNWLLDARTLEADNLVAYVHNLYKSNNTINVRDIVRTYAYAVMMRMMFGQRHLEDTTKDGGMGPMDREHVDAIFKAVDSIFGFNASAFVPFLRDWNLGRHEKETRETGETIDKYHNPIINERIESWKAKEGREAVGDWLDIFITLKDGEGKPLLTPQEINGLCKDICIAAIDNPTNLVEWTLAEMMNQPETLEKAVEELDRVVGRDRLVQENDIPNLNYIKACCRESFRLHPVAPFLPPHVAMEDTSLAGYFVPKGSHVLVNRVLLGRNPKIWEDPDIFRPERHVNGDRFSQEVSLLEPSMRFVSFGTGRRGCLGGKLGTYMTVMLLGRLLQGFIWSLPTGSGSGKGRVELVESETNLLMAEPLVASVKPRLALHMYPKMRN